MHTQSLEPWKHDHIFGQDIRRFGEQRTRIVIIITAVTMIIEIIAGIFFNSMALLADGLHMGSHASALAIAAFAYAYTRRHAHDPKFNFGTGKVNSLAGFAGAVLLAIFALIMAVESIRRFFSPVTIEFNQAILVAVLGLLVNLICLMIFRAGQHPHHGHSAGHHHDHSLEHHHDHGHEHHHAADAALGGDHNLLSAYLHVLADALTSVLAIGALLAVKYFGWVRIDPLMGILGAVMVVRWSWGLLKISAHVLLDIQAPDHIQAEVRHALEHHSDNRIADLHIWSVGPSIYAAEITLVTSDPKEPESYLNRLPDALGIVHCTIEVRRCPDTSPAV